MIRKDIPRTVFALGLVSLFMDVSSEMVHSLLPLFLVTVLGASATRVGIIEGIAEGTAMVVKIFSGALSDWIGKRKPLALLGYGLGAATKPLFALAPTVGVVFAARFLDRIGKGIRGAPRDALIADVTPAEMRGAAYGLRQSMDTVGALLGPALAMAVLWASDGNYRLVFWIAGVPGFIAVATLFLGVKEPEVPKARKARSPLHRNEIGQLGTGFWLVVAFGAILSLARFSEAFLLLRAGDVGLAPHFAPALLVVMNVVYMLTAYPVGRLSDRIGRGGLLASGIAALALSDLVLAGMGSAWGVVLGSALWGLQMGLTQGLLSALVADSAPAGLRGTAFGLFNLAGGLATVAASMLAGWAWDRYGAPAPFHAGAVFCLGALGVYALMKRHTRMKRHSQAAET